MAAQERERKEAQAAEEGLVGRLACEVHGPLRHRPEQRLWACAGFDGEGCSQLHASGGVSDEAAARLTAERTYWPGINANGKDWAVIRKELRQRGVYLRRNSEGLGA